MFVRFVCDLGAKIDELFGSKGTQEFHSTSRLRALNEDFLSLMSASTNASMVSILSLSLSLSILLRKNDKFTLYGVVRHMHPYNFFFGLVLFIRLLFTIERFSRAFESRMGFSWSLQEAPHGFHDNAVARWTPFP